MGEWQLLLIASTACNLVLAYAYWGAIIDRNHWRRMFRIEERHGKKLDQLLQEATDGWKRSAGYIGKPDERRFWS